MHVKRQAQTHVPRCAYPRKSEAAHFACKISAFVPHSSNSIKNGPWLRSLHEVEKAIAIYLSAESRCVFFFRDFIWRTLVFPLFLLRELFRRNPSYKIEETYTPKKYCVISISAESRIILILLVPNNKISIFYYSMHLFITFHWWNL